MTSLLIRNVDPAMHARLKARAAEHRRSLEEEAREVLRTGLARPAEESGESLTKLARRLFRPEHGVEFAIPPRGSAPSREPPNFSDPDSRR